jgi:Lon protease-like protein
MHELPLFPLHSVLCPGIALPLHIFEARYRAMIGRCLEDGSPFGVVLIRDGREVGPLATHIAAIGTTAVIRQAGRYPDGRLDIVTVGERRFRIMRVEAGSEPYLVGQVEEMDEPLGGPSDVAAALAERVSRRFLAYLDLVDEALRDEEGGGRPGERAPRPGQADAATSRRSPPGEPASSTGAAASDSGADDAARREILRASAQRLLGSGDPTAVSYLLTGLVQLDLAARQALLEVPDTVGRLGRLDRALFHEQRMLERGLRPLALDLGVLALRRN